MIQRPSSRFALAAWVLLLLGTTPPAAAQDFEPAVLVRAEAPPEAVLPGALVTVKVTAVIDGEFHIYGLPPVPRGIYPTRVVVVGPEGWEAKGATRGPEPDLHLDESMEGGPTEVPWYSGTVVFEQDVLVPANAPAGEATITVGLDHMACTETFCLDPETIEATVSITVAAGAIAPPAGAIAPPADGDDSEGEDSSLAYPGSEKKSGGAFLWVYFWAGLLSILLPCIYPLIPLTVAFFTKHEGSRGSAVFRAVLFCVGIMISFTLLGVVLGPALQTMATSIWLNVFLFLLMVVLALSLFGMFDFRLPSSWTDRMQSAGSGAGILAPVFMGVAFSLASFTCTVGVIGPLLAGAADDWARAAIGMFAYSTGFAIPFFGLALFPMLLTAMPRSGGWMNIVKVLLGFFELCFAGYYLWRMDLGLGWGIGTYPIILSLWVVTTFVAGLYLLGKIRLPHDAPVESLPVPRLLGAVFFFAFSLFLFAGFFGKVELPSWIQGLLPPKPPPVLVAGAVPEGSAAEDPAAKFHLGFGGVEWTTDYEHGLEVGRREGRRILLNFTGIYCTNCRDMETGLLPLPEVRAELKDLVLVELWTDIPSDEMGREYRTHTTEELSDRYRELRTKKYGSAANPFYVLLDPDGNRIADTGYIPKRDVGDFVRFLKTGK